MKTRTVTERIGEYLGPVDVNYDWRQHGNDAWTQTAWERLLQLCSGEWNATTDTGCPKFGWHNVLQVGMYDGWPHWRPVPSVLMAGVLGCEWHPFYSITGIERLNATEGR